MRLRSGERDADRRFVAGRDMLLVHDDGGEDDCRG